MLFHSSSRVHSLEPSFPQSSLRFGSIPLDIHIATPGSSERISAAHVVDRAYARYYNVHHTVKSIQRVNLGYDRYDSPTYTIVATYTYRGRKLILGTMRAACYSTTDVAQLFEPRLGCRWPHEEIKNSRSGELARFALHEIFEDPLAFAQISDIPVSTAKKLLCRELYLFSRAFMRSQGITITYVIMSNHVARFARRSGLTPIRLEMLQPRMTEEAVAIRLAYSGYWQPDSPPEEQPAVYRLL